MFDRQPTIEKPRRLVSRHRGQSRQFVLPQSAGFLLGDRTSDEDADGTAAFPINRSVPVLTRLSDGLTLCLATGFEAITVPIACTPQRELLLNEAKFVSGP